MFILDSLLVGGLRFVLDKIASAADQELNDERALRDQLLAAQMQVELGELTQADFAAIEAGLLARLRTLRSQRGEEATGALTSGDYRITGIDATFEGDEHR